jgi:hypothetical protein
MNPAGKTLSNAAHFWEPLRIWYSAFLAAVVVAWVTFSWPHFRGSLGQFALWLLLFLVVANVGYCAGYPAEILLRAALPAERLVWPRRALWVLGLALAILAENYWIADEIYPYPISGHAVTHFAPERAE